jgi:hypothetical protein
VLGLGWLLLRGAGSVLSAPRGQPPPPPSLEEQKKSGAIGIVIFAALLPLMIAGVADGYQGHASFAVTSEFIIAFWALLLFLTAVSALAGRLSDRMVLRKYAGTEELPDTTAADWRARAAQLRMTETAADPEERERRIADLFSVACPVLSCRAPLLVPCALSVPPAPFAIVDKVSLRFCHLARMRKAVKEGSAKEADIAAQFDNNVPEGVL